MDCIDRKLHNEIPRLNSMIQDKIDNTGPGYDAILLGFGLCGKSTEKIKAGRIPVVIPKAHDCITLLLGSREEYIKQFSAHPGTYYYSISLLDKDSEAIGQDQFGQSADSKYDEYLKKYGAENAKYLTGLEKEQTKNYTRLAFIHHNIAVAEPYRNKVHEINKQFNLKYEELLGNLALLFNLIEGYWDEKDFLVLNPDEIAVASNNDSALKKLEL